MGLLYMVRAFATKNIHTSHIFFKTSTQGFCVVSLHSSESKGTEMKPAGGKTRKLDLYELPHLLNKWEVAQLCTTQDRKLICLWFPATLPESYAKLKIIWLPVLIFLCTFWTTAEHITNGLSTKQRVQRLQHIIWIEGFNTRPFNPSTLQLLGIPSRRCFTKKSCESIICTNGNTAFARVFDSPKKYQPGLTLKKQITCWKSKKCSMG